MYAFSMYRLCNVYVRSDAGELSAMAFLPLIILFFRGKGNRFMKIPTNSIIDGVEILQNKAQTGVDANTKRLFSYIDAGYTHINATSGYNGETVYRKTEQLSADGRIILADTNNSQSDFGVSTGVEPREVRGEW